MVRAMLAPGEGESLAHYLARGVAGTFALKLAYSALTFVGGLILARTLGVTGFGVYAYALAWIVVLSAPSGLGFDKLIVRQVAAYRVQSAWGQIRALLQQTNRITLIVSLGVLVAAGIVSLILAAQIEPQVRVTFWAALLLLPLLNLIRVRQAALQGLGHAVIGQMPETLIYPLIFVSLLLAANFILVDFTAPWAIALSVLASLIALGIGARILNGFVPQVAATARAENLKAWARQVLPFVVLSSLQIGNSRVATLMLGTLQGPDQVGIYAVAERWAEYVTFFLSALVPVLAPTIARLYAEKDLRQLQRVITTSTQLTFLVSAPVAFAFILFGSWFLLLYGEGFTPGHTALAILSVGQLFSVAAGSVAWLLFMTGYETDALKSVATSFVINLCLCALLIPSWSVEGAAMAEAASVVAWNGLMVFWVYRRIGIHSTVLGNIRLQRNA